jgi:hypothetical protein
MIKNYFLLTFAVSVFLVVAVSAVRKVSEGIGAAVAVPVSDGTVSIITLSVVVVEVSTFVSFLQLNTVRPNSINTIVNFIIDIFCNVFSKIIHSQNVLL